MDTGTAETSTQERLARWREASTDPTKPNIARVYDYWLGGTSNLVADRELAEAMATLDPWIPAACRANRAFLGRAVRYAARQGIRQFIDLGSGIPTVGNVHEIAQAIRPEATVLYVDRDPVAAAESRNLLAGNSNAAIIQADIRDLDAILADREFCRLITADEPLAIVLVAVLHFLTDDDTAYGIVARLRAIAPPGSFLVVSHATSEGSSARAEAAEHVYNERAADGKARTRAEIAQFFGCWDLIDPGLVFAPCWRPARPQDVPLDADRYWFLAGVARNVRCS